MSNISHSFNSKFKIQNSKFNIPLRSFAQNFAFLYGYIFNSTFNIQHSTFNILSLFSFKKYLRFSPSLRSSVFKKRDNSKFKIQNSTFIILLSIFTLSSPAQELRKIENKAFIRGEVLKYKVYYRSFITGKITAGEAILEVKNENKLFGNRSTYHIVGTGLTKGVFNLFFKVVDKYESFIDDQAILPWLFYRRVNEGGYKIEQDIIYNRYNNTAKDVKSGKVYNILPDAQDILSMFYYTRTLDVSNIKIGDELLVNSFIDFEPYPFKIKFIGREVLKTSMGKFNCLKFSPLLLKGNVFKEEAGMIIWFTDDDNHIPILLETTILVGSIKLELIKCSNLANPQNKLSD